MININKIRGEKGASALLVAILVMGVLLTLTLGLSTLIVREIRQTADIVTAGQAYFAAEAGMESALLDLAENLPGYEAEVVYPLKEEGDENLNYVYMIGNKGDRYPYFPDDQPVFLRPDQAVTKDFLYDEMPSRTYNVLPLNESVTIPLFTVDENGRVNNIQQFLIQYYVSFDDDLLKKTQIQEEGSSGSRSLKLDDFDILRWKVFGNPCGAGGDCGIPNLLKTDAISDFYPATENVSAEQPVCIGTPGMLNHYGVNCFAPIIQDVIRVGDYTSVEEIADWNNAGFSYARQCYVSEVTDQSVGSLKGEVVMTQCNIDRFIQTHTRNYVTLTNMVNPDLIGINPETTPQYANIYYRIITAGGENSIVREFADINADGYSRGGEVRQSINAKLRLSSFLPVFNFSLYRTDTTTDEVDSPFKNLPGMFQKSPSAVSGLKINTN